jgi:hypothetical protein
MNSEEKRLLHNKKQIEYYHKHKKQLQYYYQNTDKIKQYMINYRKNKINKNDKNDVENNSLKFKIEYGTFILYFD